MKFEDTRRGSLMLMLAAVLGTGACQTIPRSRLDARQIAILKEQGFTHTERGWEISVDDRLLFEVDRSDVGPGQLPAIARLARGLTSVGIHTATVEGHADDTGTASYNLELSARRAKSVANVLAENGFSRTGLIVRGLGDRFPVDDNRTAVGRRENRRVVILIAAL